jgi:hypothetical protein
VELAAADEGVGHRQGVDEAAALVPDVDRGDGAQAEQPLEEHAVAGGEVIGCGRGVENEIDRAGLEPGGLERSERGPVGQRRAGVTLAGPATLLDAGARPDPFVARVHQVGEVVVGDDPVGHRETGPEKPRTGHS